MALMFVLRANWLLECSFFFGRPTAALGFYTIALDRGQHAGSLFATHDGNPCIGPHPQEARRECSAAHAVITGTETATDDHGQLRYCCGRDRSDHLRAIASDAFVFIFAADHEAGDVLQEDQWDLALTTELNEMGTLERRLRKQDAIVGDDANWHSHQMGKAAHQRGAIARLEF